ncbi:hypothetical protein FBUS_04399 [Fasciolopsis buskii]|uniref:Uncharacterized protein n=1 Tax=Fasciolopsis buskii TaxID=27845 RepID=A0A8E0VPL1_9TREM|nr:hypothetical protein FBUS_04399 [Fasciolopsis buski]
MIRRRDMLQPVPENIPLENSTVYRVSFQGEQCERAVRFQPVDEGINGLETVLQCATRETAKTQNSLSTKPDEQLKRSKNGSIESIYRSDYGHGCRNSAPQLPQYSLTLQKGSTNYRDHYHTWVPSPPSGFLIDRVGFNWKPKPAVYIPPDPRKHEAFASKTSYRDQFSYPLSVDAQDSRQKKPPLARRSEITQSRLLSSFNGVTEQLPTSLYRDSFVSQHGADRWAERNVRQHTCPFIHRTGPNQQIDDLYWADVETDAYGDYRKSVFHRTKVDGKTDNRQSRD